MLKAKVEYYLTDDKTGRLFSAATGVTMYFNGNTWDFGVYTLDGLVAMLYVKQINQVDALKITRGLTPRKLYRMIGVNITKKIRTKKVRYEKP